MSALFLIALAVAAALILRRFHQSRMQAMERRLVEPTCDQCGYIILGLQSPRCPECGTPISSDSPSDLEN
jgi:rubrerythrin